MTRIKKAYKALISNDYTMEDWDKDVRDSTRGYLVQSGVKVNEENALKYTAVYACIRVLSETLASLPLHVYRKRTTGGGQDRATDHPLYDILHAVPNDEMPSMTWRETAMAHVLTGGNCYSEIILNRRGEVASLYPIPWTQMKPVRNLKTREIEYELSDRGRIETLPAAKILHIPGLGFNGIKGYSPIRMAMESIGLGLAAESFGARFFGSGTHLGGIIEHPQGMSDEAFNRLKKSFEEEYGGLQKSHGTIILEEGAKYNKLGMPLDEAQFLECVVPGTLITMTDGTRKTAEELAEGDMVMGWDDGPVSARVSAIGKPPLKKLVRLTTVRGRELTASFDHPCLVKERMRTAGGRTDKKPEIWKPLGEIEPGEFVRVGLGNVWDGQSGDFDIAWLLGALVGDDYIRSGGCSFATIDDGVLQKMNKTLSTMGAGLSKVTSNECDYAITTGGKGCKGSPFRQLINKSKLVDKGSAGKRVPLSVLLGGPNTWTGFLSGYLDTDGSVTGTENKGQPLAYWSSINRDLLKDCQHLLSMLGINSSIYLMKKAHTKEINGHAISAKTQWGLYVTGVLELGKLASLLTPAHSVKKERLSVFLGTEESRYRKENWLYDRVKNVEHLGEGETVGIEIEGCHTHITNGLVTHNTRKFQKTEIAGIYRVPPHMIADLEKATFSNIEHMSLEFLMYSMRPWIYRWEQYMNWKLFSLAERKDRGLFTEFAITALLRGDTKSQAEALHIARQDGIVNADEWREMIGMNPQEGNAGKVYLANGNLRSTEALAKEPAGTTKGGGTD